MSKRVSAVRSISKLASNVTVPPSKHLHTFTPFSTVHWPPVMMSMSLALESVTSLAVQVRFALLPCAFQTSWIQFGGGGVCADAAWGPKSNPTAKTAIEVASSPVGRLQNLVRHERLFIMNPFRTM